MASTTFVDGSTLTAAAWFNDVNTITYNIIGVAASKIVPGATSFSVRNTADNADNLLVSNAGAVTVRDALVVSGTGPHAIGGATEGQRQIWQQGTFSGSAAAIGYQLQSTMAPTAGNIAYGMEISPTLNRAGSGTHVDFASLVIDPPTIGAGAAALTNASTVKITGAPTAGTNTRAFWVTAGASQFDAAVGLSAVATGSGLTVGAASTNNDIWNASQGAGTATLYIGNASINVTSDERLKSNIYSLKDGLSIINALLPIEFDQDEERPWGEVRHYIGFGARHTHKVAPWAVHTQGDTGLPWKMRQEFLMAPVVRALQQIDERIKALEAR